MLFGLIQPPFPSLFLLQKPEEPHIFFATGTVLANDRYYRSLLWASGKDFTFVINETGVAGTCHMQVHPAFNTDVISGAAAATLQAYLVGQDDRSCFFIHTANLCLLIGGLIYSHLMLILILLEICLTFHILFSICILSFLFHSSSFTVFFCIKQVCFSVTFNSFNKLCKFNSFYNIFCYFMYFGLTIYIY